VSASLGARDAANVVPRIVTANAEGGGLRREALATGHEGVMAKAVDGLCAARRRGGAWLKVNRRARWTS
jgi:DNA ligase-1